MNWIWQQPGWPDFTWSQAELAPLEARFRDDAGRRIGAWRRLGEDERIELRVGWLSDEAAETSAIEGELLDRDSVQSSIRRQFGLAHDQRPASPAEAGVAEMMVSVYREFDRPLDHDTLRDWHRMLMRERQRLNVIGGYRRHAEPTQVVSGPEDRPTVHYVAPPSDRITMEMDRYLAWYERASTGEDRLAPLTWAGVAHLYFVFIHPFEDGNGRIGRALAEKALARALRQPSLIALARTILRRRRAYYDALRAANDSLDITGWLVWFAGIVLEAQTWSERRLIRTAEQTRMFDRLRGRLNPRQEKTLLRLFRAEPDGFEGGTQRGKTIVASPAHRHPRRRGIWRIWSPRARCGVRVLAVIRATGWTCHHSASSVPAIWRPTRMDDETPPDESQELERADSRPRGDRVLRRRGFQGRPNDASRRGAT